MNFKTMDKIDKILEQKMIFIRSFFILYSRETKSFIPYSRETKSYFWKF